MKRMWIIDELNNFFIGNKVYNIVSFFIGGLSLICSFISYHSAKGAKKNASDAADIAGDVSGKLNKIEAQLAYIDNLKMEYVGLLKDAQNYIGNRKEKIRKYISILNRIKNSRLCLLNRDEIDGVINNLNKEMVKETFVGEDDSVICTANGLVESFIESLGFIIVGKEISD